MKKLLSFAVVAALATANQLAAEPAEAALATHQVNFEWQNVIQMPPIPPGTTAADSPQVLHFYRRGRDIWQHPDSVAYIKQHMQGAKVFDSDADHMRYALDQVDEKSGLLLEFGVCSGKSINFIAALKPRSVIHGFDSFQGLPEDWTEMGLAQGTFGAGANHTLFIPPVLNNVRLWAGMFETVLPLFVREIVKDQAIAFIHVDCDLYSSTKTVFHHLKNNIRPGAVIVFDEYMNYDNWQRHEYRAFQEFIAAAGLTYEYLSFNQCHQQVAVRITGYARQQQEQGA